MSTQFISPVGRLVQGGLTLRQKTDMKGQPVLDSEGKHIEECFMALAIRKDDPQLSAFYAAFDQQARASFPHLFPNGGNCTHPKFAWKVQDGDGVGSDGQSVANKPGYAGCYIFKMATRFAPRCFHHGKYDPSQVITNPDEVIKKGYFIRVSGTVDGNGVQPGNAQAVPGLFVSPNLVELVAFGEEIVSGPDASKVFGDAPVGALPVGASTAPVLPVHAGNGLTPPALPGTAAAPLVAPALPAVGGSAQPGAALPLPAVGGNALPLPPQPGAALPLPPAQFVMQPSAQGATREQLHAIGWTDAMLIAQGHMVTA